MLQTMGSSGRLTLWGSASFSSSVYSSVELLLVSDPSSQHGAHAGRSQAYAWDNRGGASTGPPRTRFSAGEGHLFQGD